MMWWCWRKLRLLVLFSSILYVLVIFLWLTDESQALGQTFSVYYTITVVLHKKVTDLICYIQTVNLAFIEHTSIFAYVFMYFRYIFDNTVISSKITGHVTRDHLELIFVNYTVLLVLRNVKYSPHILQKFPGHLVAWGISGYINTCT